MVKPAVQLLVIAAALHVAPKFADACTIMLVESRLLVTEAAPGQVWWLHGTAVGDSVELEGADGTRRPTEIVSADVPGVVIVRVPLDSQAGESFRVVASEDVALEVAGTVTVAPAEGEPSVDSIPIPDFDVDLRAVPVNYRIGAAIPNGTCGSLFAIIISDYGQRPWVRGETPSGFALDVVVRSSEMDSFGGNIDQDQVHLVGHVQAEVDESVSIRGDYPAEPIVDLRYRRISDGMSGPVNSFEFDDLGTDQLGIHIGGCSDQVGARRGDAEVWVGVLSVVLLAGGFRSRRLVVAGHRA